MAIPKCWDFANNERIVSNSVRKVQHVNPLYLIYV